MPTPNDIPTYILLKDLPDAKAGIELVLDDKGYCYHYKASNNEPCWYLKEYVENNANWFQKKESKTIKEQPIEEEKIIFLPKGFMNCFITLDYFFADTNNSANYQRIKFPLPDGKWVIKNRKEYSATNQVVIKKVLNPTQTTEQTQWSNLSFTKEKLDAMMENVFNAARLTHPLAGMKFESFKDYYNSLPEIVLTVMHKRNKLTVTNKLINKKQKRRILYSMA